MSKRSKFAKVFYGLAIVISLANFIYIIAIHWEFILQGKGVGSFAVIWAMIYGVVTAIIWLIAFILEKNNRLTIIYWLTIFAPVLLLALQPVKFYIE